MAEVDTKAPQVTAVGDMRGLVDLICIKVMYPLEHGGVKSASYLTQFFILS